MNTEKPETEHVTIELDRPVLKQIDRIVNEKGLSREQVISNILKDHFSSHDDWLDNLIR